MRPFKIGDRVIVNGSPAFVQWIYRWADRNEYQCHGFTEDKRYFSGIYPESALRPLELEDAL
jgi:hypothetical protein